MKEMIELTEDQFTEACDFTQTFEKPGHNAQDTIMVKETDSPKWCPVLGTVPINKSVMHYNKTGW